MSELAAETGSSPDQLIARMERLPISRTLVWTRVVVGTATFFDGYTTLAIAFVLPVLSKSWNLSPAEIGWIISSGYIGQLFGALGCSWAAERFGRLKVLTGTIVLYTFMSLLCVFSWNAASLMLFRFIQGIGTGGEVPVASAYINEFAAAQRRGRFFLMYEVLFVVGLAFAAGLGRLLVPVFGWQSLFYVGLLPAVLTLPMRFFLPESPRWLIRRGRTGEAEGHDADGLAANGAGAAGICNLYRLDQRFIVHGRRNNFEQGTDRDRICRGRPGEILEQDGQSVPVVGSYPRAGKARGCERNRRTPFLERGWKMRF